MVWIFIFIALILFFGMIIDIPTTVFLLCVYAAGMVICYLLNRKDWTYSLKIYHALFTVGAIYMLLAYSYMMHHGYNFLLAFDIHNYFLPQTELYLSEGSLGASWAVIWDGYDFFNRFQPGYFTYAVLFGYLAEMFQANFYVSQQISVLFLYAFVGGVIYKLFRINRFSEEKAYRYTLLIAFFSVLFFYSSQVLRDIHILLLYLLTIYLTYKRDFSINNLLKILILIFICTTFRLESGLFLMLLFPAYLLLTMQQSRIKKVVIFFSVIIGIVAVALSSSYLVQIESTVEENQGNYINHIAEGEGVIAALQRVPIAGDFASIIYNAVQPLPFWSKLSTDSSNVDDQATYNIMTFPRSLASLFNWFAIVTILVWLLSRKIRQRVKSHISKPLAYQLWIGLLFLFLQSAVIAQRRLMPFYVIYYILSFTIYTQLQKEERRYVQVVVVTGFIILQVVGVIYLMS